MKGDGWREVWERRTLEPSRGSTLAQLMAADGLDTAFGETSEVAWRDFVERRAATLGARAGTSVYEVGCGAGAFLFVLAELGCRVGGLDRSATLIDFARRALPDGRFDIAEAIALEREPRADVVVSCGAFLYFPSLQYAEQVIAAMAARATGAVGILDLPDASLRAAALAQRIELAGGQDAYNARYAGLEHLHFSREWVTRALAAAGLTGIQTADQDMAGYRNGAHRFNAWGFAGEAAASRPPG
jgi:SAM-dependent methyltransferase